LFILTLNISIYIYIKGVDHQKLTDLAEKYFGKVPAGSDASLLLEKYPARFTGSDVSYLCPALNVTPAETKID
jgi:predicted Zn-dependent peptidase